MRGSRGNLLPGTAGLVVALTATVCLLCVSAARSAPAQPFEQAERSALLEVYAAESALARARGDAEALGAQADRLRRRERQLTGHLALVRKSHEATQKRIGTLLRALYESDRHADPIAIFLGATSLDEALEGVETLSQAAALHRRLAAEAVAREREVGVALERAVTGRRASEAAAREAASAAAELDRTLAQRTATLGRIRREHALSQARVAKLEVQAATAQARSERITEAATSAPAATSSAESVPQVPTVAADGTRTLTVDAVAYHLPGNTASGIPVGLGVIAVDPTVIPLGARVFVPGYGPAVAADTGSAIKGLIIDLWMPTTAQARAWGRRTVTITIYG